MRRLFDFFLLLSALFGLRGSALAEHPLILVSIAPQKFIVDSIANGLVNSVSLIPAGANHETFEPGMSQLSLLNSAAVYFTIGHPDLSFERRWIEYFGKDLKVIPTAVGGKMIDHDPHVWNSPKVMAQMVEIIARELELILPEGRSQIADQADKLRHKIWEVEEQVRILLAQSKRKEFFVFHPAWGYFADFYGLTQIAIEDHGKEPGAGRIGAIVDRVRAAGIDKIFVQPQFPKSAVELIASEAGVEIVESDPASYDWVKSHLAFAKAIAGVVK